MRTILLNYRSLIRASALAGLCALALLPACGGVEGRGGGIDSDEDGLSDVEERRLNTNPFDPDTDLDGLLDGEEVFDFFTNPNVQDTDQDGLFDDEEVRGILTDENGVTIRVTNFFTDPNVEDSDADGLFDGEEVVDLGTHPLLADSDSDGLSDGEEELDIGTDPLDPDTDNDGFSDGEEVRLGRNPLVPNS